VYASTSAIKVTKSMRMRWADHAAIRNAYKILVRNPERKRPLTKSRSTWEGDIGMDLREIEWEGVDWMHLA
jgi:hypothetical protein